jgi:hypothetical protein
MGPPNHLLHQQLLEFAQLAPSEYEHPIKFLAFFSSTYKTHVSQKVSKQTQPCIEFDPHHLHLFTFLIFPP